MCSIYMRRASLFTTASSHFKPHVLQFLAVCREMGTSALCTMNIFCQGERSSGFTLDKVELVDTRYISAELIDMAQERYQTRRMGITMGTDLFEVSNHPRIPDRYLIVIPFIPAAWTSRISHLYS